MKAKTKLYIIVGAAIILIWWFYPLLVLWLSRASSQKLDGSTERLGALFSALAFAGLFITIYFQRKDYLDTRKYNNLNEFIELYRYFTSSEFRAARIAGWATLKRCLINAEYGNYVLGESYVQGYVNKLTSQQIYEKFAGQLVDMEIYTDATSFCKADSADRHKLDDVINFYLLLSMKETSSPYFDTADFFYDSWRPMLYWYAFKSEELYSSAQLNKQFNNPPGLLNALKRLDKKFFCPEDLSKIDLTQDNIEEHVLIKGIKAMGNSVNQVTTVQFAAGISSSDGTEDTD